MKQIPIYKGISKKVTVFGPALIAGQNYKCVIFPDLNASSAPYTISNIAEADETEIGSGKVFVEFTFPAETIGSVKGTDALKLGDNNLAVYDVKIGGVGDEYSMYKVYEAKVYAEDSYARLEQEEEPES